MLQYLGDTQGARGHADMVLYLRPNDYDTLYNCACYYARAGEPEPALELLERAVATGQGFRDWIGHDADLNSLRRLPRFQGIMARIE
ncbi:MAG: TPR end-of-group domain-containing protein [Luteimonas sp.]